MSARAQPPGSATLLPPARGGTRAPQPPLVWVWVILSLSLWPSPGRAQEDAGATPSPPTGGAAPDPSSGTGFFDYPPTQVDVLSLRRSALAADWATLEALFTQLHQATLQDFRAEMELRRATDAFAYTDPALTQALSRWEAEHPTSWVPHLLMATHLDALGDASRGTRYANEVRSERMEIALQRYQEAVNEAEEALRLEPTLVVAHRLLIFLGRSLGDAAMVDAHFQAGLQSVPQSLLLRTARMAALQPRWGGSHEQMRAAADEGAAAAARPGGNPALVVLRGYVPYDLATSLHADGETQRALERIDAAVAAGGYLIFHEERGDLLVKLQRYREAVEAYTQALRFEPQYVDALAGRSEAYYELGARDLALADAEAALALEPDLPRGHHLKASIEHLPLDASLRLSECRDRGDAGDRAGAQAACDEAVALAPQSHYVFLGRGHRALDDGRTEAARADIRRAVALAPWDEDGYRLLGGLANQEGDYRACVDAFTQALAINPEFGPSYMARAFCNRELGEDTRIRADLVNACELGVEEACVVILNHDTRYATIGLLLLIAGGATLFLVMRIRRQRARQASATPATGF